MILDPAPVAVTSGHAFAAGGFTSPFSFGSLLDVEVVGGALIVALLLGEMTLVGVLEHYGFVDEYSVLYLS